MAQGRNTELATGMATSSADSGAGAKNTGSTTMPAGSSGKPGIYNADKGAFSSMSNYTPPTAGSMVTKGGSGLRGGFGGFGGGGMFNKTR